MLTHPERWLFSFFFFAVEFFFILSNGRAETLPPTVEDDPGEVT
jgi:hypothetical protein